MINKTEFKKGFDTVKRRITLIQVLFLCVFIACGSYLGKFYYDKSHTEKEFDELKDLIVDDGTLIDDSDGFEITVDNGSSDTEEPVYADNGMLRRYTDLYEKNNEMVGWIKIPDTNIDYPVMFNSSDNEYYLHRNFYKEKSSAGIPYLDSKCNLAAQSDNLIIYGHNMTNGTMFHDLLKYQYQDFADSHNIIYFDSMYKMYQFEVFAVFRTSVGSSDEFKYYEFTNTENEQEFDEFIARCKRESMIRSDITPKYGDKVLCLSTCSYNTKNERTVVVGKMTSVK